MLSSIRISSSRLASISLKSRNGYNGGYNGVLTKVSVRPHICQNMAIF